MTHRLPRLQQPDDVTVLLQKCSPCETSADSADGRRARNSYTVRYKAVNAMLLNEFLKEHRKVEEQTAIN